MDESVISGPSSSSGGASQATSSGSQGRFPSFNGPDLNARNILDESLDIEASGAATGDGLVDDDQEDISFTKQSYSNEGRRDGQPSSASSSRANAARMGSALNAPVAELAALAIQEGPGRSGSQLDTAPNSNVAADSGIKKEAAAIAIDRDDALPIEPPLSAEERRQHSLKRERDDLAKMNTLLEQAIASIERTVPKFERFQDTMKTSHKLLDTYTRILSQADHTQQLLLDGNWEVQRDEDEIREEQEAELRQRREEEERILRELREAEEREARAQEEMALKAAKAAAPAPSGRGRVPSIRGTRGIPSTRGRASNSQRGSTARGTGKTRGGSL